MIGLAVHPTEREAAREFFELCKSPWEFCRGDGQYEVLICTSEPPSQINAALVLIFTAESTKFDFENTLILNRREEGTVAVHAGRRFPIYGPAATFSASTIDLVTEEGSQQRILFAQRTSERTIVRIGYNLFGEVHRLLTTGQPIENAGIPTLELHINLLRDMITRADLPFLEIPPIPEGYDSIACLTHDIDHPILRNHSWDHTMVGFLYRASIGSVINFGRGRLSLRDAAKNWAAAFRMPLVLVGLARDFWSEFARDYLKIEANLGATYFVIPEKNKPGRKADGSSSPKRACGYDIAELVPQLTSVLAAGNEVGLHGLDAWRDVNAAHQERARVSETMGIAEMGVRMHWLYFDEGSPAVLDQAGFTYDSTFGYNQTVGYRAGTTQVYQPRGTRHLLELPLHVMDTALFYPSYLNLTENAAYRLVSTMFEDVKQFGGVLTFNWHDRSLAPDRLWGNFYLRLLQEMKKRRTWFATASQAVAWFRKRRHATFALSPDESTGVSVQSGADTTDTLPKLKIRIHQPLHRSATELLAHGPSATFVDVNIEKTTELNLKSSL